MITKYETKSGPRWRVEWRVAGREKRRKSFTTERAARDFDGQLRADRARGVTHDPRRGRVTVTEVYRRWLASRPDLREKVRRGYEDCWRLRVEPAFGAWAVGKVDRASVQEWVNTMAVGPRTQRWTHGVLKMVCGYAVEEGLIVRNPCSQTKFPALPDPVRVFLTAGEVEQLAELCGDGQGDVVLFLAYLGLRWGELAGLNVGDVDLAARRVTVRRSVSAVGGRLTENAPKTRAGSRRVPIPDVIVPALRARLGIRPDDEPAFPAPHGGRLRRENWVRDVRWNDAKKALGKPALRIHDLRHTYASLARSAGADLRLLQATMGHANVTVTANTYSHLFDAELDAVADALGTLRERPKTETGPVGPQTAHSEGQLTIFDELNRDQNSL